MIQKKEFLRLKAELPQFNLHKLKRYVPKSKTGWVIYF